MLNFSVRAKVLHMFNVLFKINGLFVPDRLVFQPIQGVRFDIFIAGYTHGNGLPPFLPILKMLFKFDRRDSFQHSQVYL